MQNKSFFLQKQKTLFRFADTSFMKIINKELQCHYFKYKKNLKRHIISPLNRLTCQIFFQSKDARGLKNLDFNQ